MEYVRIEDYIQLNILDRQQHVDLKERCIEIGGGSKDFRGLLAHFLKTTLPSGSKVQLCHVCHNSKCSNVKHLYWGTASENKFDAVKNGTHVGWKISLEKRREISSKGGKGGKGRKRVKLGD